jgi:hypothetical protein
MDKIEALEKLKSFIDRHNCEEELPELLEKFEQMTENDFLECTASNQVYHVIVGWSKPKTKRKPSTTPKIQVYYKLNTPIQEATEKAIGIVTGQNNLHGKNYRTFIEWIPLSKIKQIEKDIFIPAWIISKNGLWYFVDKESKITL